jgi:signal peptidase II
LTDLSDPQHQQGSASGSNAQRKPVLFGALTRIGLLTALLTGLIDQISKLWLLFGLDLENRGVVPLLPTIDLVLTWNTGISYGLLQQNTALGRWLLLGFKFLAVGFLWVWLARAESRRMAIALGLIIGGALGNAVDVIAYGAVADFVFFHFAFASWEFRWYVFNLADAAIVAGVIGLLYDSVFSGRAAKAP